jgi:hypothetical protein
VQEPCRVEELMTQMGTCGFGQAFLCSISKPKPMDYSERCTSRESQNLRIEKKKQE